MNEIKTKQDRLSAEMAIMYVLADMMETQMMTVEGLAMECGFSIKHELKAALGRMKKGAREFHMMMRKESGTSQLMIGACSDTFLQFLKLMVDRTQEDVDMFKIYNLVKNSIPSRRGWDLAESERDAFSDILNGLTDETCSR